MAEGVMRDLFWGYYRPNEEWFQKLWQECIFAFDTNVLLNFYRYKGTTQKTLFTILEKIQDRIYIPYQAAFEYQKNRVEVIHTQEKAYSEILNTVNTSFEKLTNELNGFRRHPIIDIKNITDKLESMKVEIQNDIDMLQRDHPENLMFEDSIQAHISDLFDGKVGKQLIVDNVLKTKLETRYKEKRPPGYKDAGKNNGNEYGDILLWLEVIQQAQETKKPIILITDDTKEDWWWKHKGKTLGPRPELIQEIKSEAEVDFYMYQSDTFIKYAEQYLKYQEDNSVEAIEEIRSVREQEEKSDSDLKSSIAVSSENGMYITSELAAALASNWGGNLPNITYNPEIAKSALAIDPQIYKNALNLKIDPETYRNTLKLNLDYLDSSRLVMDPEKYKIKIDPYLNERTVELKDGMFTWQPNLTNETISKKNLGVSTEKKEDE